MSRRILSALVVLLAACAPPSVAEPSASATALAPADLPSFFDCLREQRATIISAHRGGPAPGYPENALETFQHTLAQAPVALEIDIGRTRDGVLVLLHDDTLDRTTTGSGRLADANFDSLQALRLKDDQGAVTDFQIPTLAQVLAWAKGRAILQLDVKRGVPFAEVIAAVRAAGAEETALIITYNTRDAAEVNRLAPDLYLSASARSQAELDQLQAEGINLAAVVGWTGTEAPDQAVFATLAAAGVEANFGTLGRPGRRLDDLYAAQGGAGWASLWRAGVNVIASDRPLEAFAAIDTADGPGVPWAACLARQ